MKHATPWLRTFQWLLILFRMKTIVLKMTAKTLHDFICLSIISLILFLPSLISLYADVLLFWNVWGMLPPRAFALAFNSTRKVHLPCIHMPYPSLLSFKILLKCHFLNKIFPSTVFKTSVSAHISTLYPDPCFIFPYSSYHHLTGDILFYTINFVSC